MKKRILAYSVLPVIGLGLLGAQRASAHGFFGSFPVRTPDEIATAEQMAFQKEAQLLGVSVDVVKKAWSEGKSFRDVAKEAGISDADLKTRLEQARITEMTNELQALVTKGVVTQAQADARLAVVKGRIAKRGSKMSFRPRMSGMMGL